MFKENQFVKRIEIDANKMTSVTELLGLLDPTPEEWIKFQYIGKTNKYCCEFPDKFVMVDEFIEGDHVSIVECYNTFNEGVV